MKSKKSSKKKNSSLFAAAVVVLALIVIFLIFLAKKDQILSNFKDTRFFDRVFGTTPEFVQNHESTPKETDNKESETITLNLLKENKTESKKTDTKEKVNTVEKTVEKVEQKTEIVEEKKSNVTEKVTETKPAETVKDSNKTTVEKKVEEKKPETTVMTEYQVCFVYIDPDGSILRKMVKKSVPKSDSPLTASINLLLKGPDGTKSSEKNYMTLIPSNTKLLSAKVQNGVAFLNFSNDFEVNSYGIDGFQGQLMQVVYTATAFSTVNSVQFLIEGEKREYLSEGIWIGSPLSRGSF